MENNNNNKNDDVKKENKKDIKNNSLEKKNKKSKKGEDKLKKEIEELKAKLKEKENNYLFLLADFENYRKRVQKEIGEARDYGKISLIESLLPIIDNLEQSLKMKDSNPQLVIKGLEMILKNFLSTLEEHNVKFYEPKEEEDFDPIHHDPLLVEDENAPEGKVLAVINKGFKYKDKVIRPSKVKIKKVTEESNDEEKSDLNSEEQKESSD